MKILKENHAGNGNQEPINVSERIGRVIQKLVDAEYILRDDETQLKTLIAAKVDLCDLITALKLEFGITEDWTSIFSDSKKKNESYEVACDTYEEAAILLGLIQQATGLIDDDLDKKLAESKKRLRKIINRMK